MRWAFLCRVEYHFHWLSGPHCDRHFSEYDACRYTCICRFLYSLLCIMDRGKNRHIKIGAKMQLKFLILDLKMIGALYVLGILSAILGQTIDHHFAVDVYNYGLFMGIYATSSFLVYSIWKKDAPTWIHGFACGLWVISGVMLYA